MIIKKKLKNDFLLNHPSPRMELGSEVFKKLIKLISITFFFVSYSFAANPDKSFQLGEYISYRCHYGFINAGKFSVFVDTVMFRVDSHYCYRTEMVGETVGAADLFTQIYDKWISYIDSSSLLSHRFVRDIHENNYRLFETTEFDRESNQCVVTTKKSGSAYEVKSYKIKPGIQDMVSTYFQLRNIDFGRLRKNDTIAVSLFLQDTTFTIKVRFDRREKIRTDVGRFKCNVFIPIIPKVENTVLNDEKPIEAWITDDQLKLPVKIKVNSRYGAVEADIEVYGNIKNKK
ncbi:MAG: DUF3108 domain-containing protein [Bacteroidota bacterium]|nr:DUF3108 domain-containing protein [Bacteroidota bacterium]